MNSIDDILSFFERMPSYEREQSIAALLETELKGKIDLAPLKKELEDYYKDDFESSLDSREPKEIMEEFCDIYGFEELIDELNDRIENDT